MLLLCSPDQRNQAEVLWSPAQTCSKRSFQIRGGPFFRCELGHFCESGGCRVLVDRSGDEAIRDQFVPKIRVSGHCMAFMWFDSAFGVPRLPVI